MSSYQHRKSHCGDKTILRPSYLHNGISYTGKMISLYSMGAQVAMHGVHLNIEMPFFNPFRPKQNGCNFADDIFIWILLNENVSIAIKISLKFVPIGPIKNIPALVQIMAWRRPGVHTLWVFLSIFTHHWLWNYWTNRILVITSGLIWLSMETTMTLLANDRSLRKLQLYIFYQNILLKAIANMYVCWSNYVCLANYRAC